MSVSLLFVHTCVAVLLCNYYIIYTDHTAIFVETFSIVQYLWSLQWCTGITLHILQRWNPFFLLKGIVQHTHLYQTVLGLDWIVEVSIFLL